MNRRKNLKLNSIDRYLKSSPNIHLEEYSSCEVPAGCGGVVLRWVNQDSSVALDLIQRFSTRASVWINGKPISNRRQYVTKGNSVLAYEFSEVDAGTGLLHVAGKDREQNLAFISEDDSSWRYTLEKPSSNAWKTADFDDSSWKPLVNRDFKCNEVNDYNYNILKETGAKQLGIQENSSGPIWIRKSFRYGELSDLLKAVQANLDCMALGVVESCLDNREFSETRGFDRQGKTLVMNKGKMRGTCTLCSHYLRPGTHVVGIRIKSGLKKPVLIASVVDNDKNALTYTQANGKWKYTTKEPSQEWLSPEYDDSDWKLMEVGEMSHFKFSGGMAKYEFEKISITPAEAISLNISFLKLLSQRTIWIRHVFEVMVEE